MEKEGNVMKKKILIVNSFYTPDIVGGAEISTQVLAESLNQQFEVYVLTSSNNKDIIYEEINGVQVIRIPNRNIYSALDNYAPNTVEKLYWHFNNTFNKKQKKAINQIIQEIRPDIIHTQNLNGIGTYIWKLGKVNNTLIMHTLRDYQLIQPTKIGLINKLIASINKKRAKHVDVVVGISRYILGEFVSNDFFNCASRKVIYNTINNKTVEKNLKKEKGPLKVSYFGRLETEKGIEFFLDSMCNVEENKVGEILVVGTGSIADQLIEKYSQDSRIKFLGKLPFEEAQEKMSYVDVVVVPSLWPEPFGRVVIESYRQGTPVVATNVGGIPEIIYNKELIINPNDKKSMREKVELIYNLGAEEYNQLSKDCLEYSLKYSRTHEDYISLYRKILAEDE
ncbi:glycosyltransferase family 4 protein [Priestia megaterium]